ncbi:MAG: S9 family peptidase [Polyangiaceae bacterium]|nr:S9 family peptidase [Polyangiaceae bacterium]
MSISRITWAVLALGALPGCPRAPEPSLTIAPSGSSSASAAPADAPPAAARRPVVDRYHGVSVTDDYRWLEAADDPEVKSWSAAQNAHARRVLDALPGRQLLAEKLRRLMTHESPDWYGLRWRGGRLFALKDSPPKQQPFLVALAGPDAPDTERVVLDPGVLDATGGTSIDWYVPSHDGKLVAISLSSGGSESGTVHVYEVDGGKERSGDAIPRVNGGTAGGSLAWRADGAGFFYTRYPAPGERPAEDLAFYQQVWFHELGADPKTDVPSLTKDLPRIAEIHLEASQDGRYLLAGVANGDGGEHEQWLLALGKDAKQDLDKWRKLAALADKVVEARFAPDGELWLRSLAGAPKGKLLKLAPTADLAKAVTVVPESDAVLDGFVVTRSRIYTRDLVGGPYQVRVFERSGKALAPLSLEPVSSVWQLAPLDGDEVLVRSESFVRPGAWHRYRGADGALVPTPLRKQSPVSYDDIEVVRETCVSKDGTAVPLNVLRKKGTKLDGRNPFLLAGYGGYGISESPWFDVRLRAWLDAGGVFADANLRGGGEFGEAWHLAGNLTKKQNVFDDFLACARHVVEAGYTRPERLGIIGGSNGGLLMGAALTQAPGQFRAVVSLVGIYDMLRVELTANGAFNVTEFGSVKDKAEFDALYAYSPYHHVADGTAYPAVLFITGANDPRVDPWHSRKMTARLQAATGGRSPVLLRTSDSTGHGIGTPLDAQVAEQIDLWSFLLHELGADAAGVEPGAAR